MANPGGTPENLQPPWPKGTSGNPAGKKPGPHISTRLKQIIEEHGLTDTIGLTLLGAALGDEKLLKGRKPNAAFMAILLDRIEGKVKESASEDEHEDNPTAVDEHGNELSP